MEEKLKLKDFPPLPAAPTQPRHLCLCVRGTNGSGKSHMVQELMRKHPRNEIVVDGWKVQDMGTFYVVGSYNSACGGLDTIREFDKIAPLVEKLILEKHVVMEGLLWSGIFGASYRLNEKLRNQGDEMVWLFLDTSSTKCVENVGKRRIALNDARPLSTKLLIAKYKSCVRIQAAAYRVGAIARTGTTDELLKTVERTLGGGKLSYEPLVNRLLNADETLPEEYKAHIPVIEANAVNGLNCTFGAFMI